jgi:hypothetical protein
MGEPLPLPGITVSRSSRLEIADAERATAA